MKKSFVILIVVTALAIYAGIYAYNHVSDAANGRIPLPPGFIEKTTEFNEEEKRMIDSLVIECARTGIIDTLNLNEIEDGPKCIIALCGKKSAFAEFPEAPKLLRECYAKHGFNDINTPIPIPKEYTVFCVDKKGKEYILQENNKIARFYSDTAAEKKASEQYEDKDHDWKECGTYEL